MIAVNFPRVVENELLDNLAADDARAIRARRDLRRVNRVIGSLSVMLGALDRAAGERVPHSLLEIGAGDGTLLRRLAQRRAGKWPLRKVVLLDRLPVVDAEALAGLRGMGWPAESAAGDVIDWLEQPSDMCWDWIIANLFIHHFSAERLARLLAAIAARSRVFFCCEPRRALLPLAGSHLIGCLGVNAVTRRDAVASVRAGFCGAELSASWPQHGNWRLHEYSAGLFSHGFLAVRSAA